MQRLGSSSCHQYRIQTVLAGNRSLLVIDNGICERLHLGNECAGVAIPHYLVGYAVNCTKLSREHQLEVISRSFHERM